MVNLTGTFSRLGRCKIMVAGDLMLDSYTIGKAKRISPEAPVAVVHVQEESHLPGGAGNVMLNLISMGAEVVALSRLGNDSAGDRLMASLGEEGIDTRGVVRQETYHTIVKNRVIADGQQIVRIDREEVKALPELVEQQIIESLDLLFEGVQLLAISDYGKGFLTVSLLRTLIEYAQAHKIAVVVDPKGFDYSRYSNATIIKPNLSEAYAAAIMEPTAPLEDVAGRLLAITNAQVLMVTRSEKGISLFHKDGAHENHCVKAREVKDVTGAGDTVLATLSVAIASGLSVSEATQLCNIAAGIAVERFGCARITLSELAQRLLESDVTNKIFDEEHLYALKHILRNKDFYILGLSGEKGLTSDIYRAIKKLSNSGDQALLVYLRDNSFDSDFIEILSSLKEVGFIVLKSDSLKHLCSEIQPKEAYILDGECLKAVHYGEMIVMSKVP